MHRTYIHTCIHSYMHSCIRIHIGSFVDNSSSRDYVMRRIAERVRDAAQAIEAGLYHNPGVHVAIMNTRDSRSTGFHWVVIMYEIRGRGH